MTRQPNAAIVGLGIEGLVREEGLPPRDLARLAVQRSIVDAGLEDSDIDGLMICRTGAATDDDLGLSLQKAAGLRDLNILEIIQLEGASAIAAIQKAAMAVTIGVASAVVCVFADAPVKSGKRASASFGRIKSIVGLEGLRYNAGLFGGAAIHALPARRYMHVYGAVEEDFGRIALSGRSWATLSPQAVFREKLSMEGYLQSRYIAEPFRLYDCAVPVNGSIAVVVTSNERAADLSSQPVTIQGFGQGHSGQAGHDLVQGGDESGAQIAARNAYQMAKISAKDIDICEFYDAFSYMTLFALEEYGLCQRGEAKDFIKDGRIAPGGALPVNTGGGHLSGYYLQGMTPIAEAILQARGGAGERQCSSTDRILVTNVGGCFDYHACLILGSEEK